MCVPNTPVGDHISDWGLFVKHEEKCCPVGPHFSKTRGVFAHIQKRPESVIGVLDTAHSQGGWAVAQACKLLNKHCVLYYPVRRADKATGLDWDPTGRGTWGDALREPQLEAERLGASLVPLEAGRSAILYHRAKKDLANEVGPDSYFMPNALKLQETITETVAEFQRTDLPNVGTIVVSASSATIAAGVILGAHIEKWDGTVVVHMGYSRPARAVLAYIFGMIGLLPPFLRLKIVIVDEGYGYADEARSGLTPPFPCNKFYDLKALRWWMSVGRARYKKALLWNIG
jgi:hypothetical protein